MKLTRIALVLTLLVLVAVALVAGCAPRQPLPTPAPPPVETPTPDPVPTSDVTVDVYWTRGEHLGVGGRMVSDADSLEPRAQAAVEALIAGPTAEETEWGLDTQIPVGVRLLGLEVDGGIARVDLTSEFASGGGSLSMTLRMAQLTYTLTQFEEIDRVALILDGAPTNALGGEGVPSGPAVTRADFESATPPVLVESPYAGQTVTDPLVVSGTSNVFEATHQLQVVEPGGRIIHDNFVTATSGTGTRGDWSVTVDLDEVSREGMGAVIVFEYSAEDGRRLNIVEVPVRFTR